MLHPWWPLLPVLFLVQLSQAQPPPQTFFPPGVPLAVRSPYLNAWYVSAGNAAPLSGTWPSFAIGGRNTLGWNGKIWVDGTAYEWMGNDGSSGAKTNANVTSFQITPTRSIFVMQAGPLNFTVTYLTPIEPSDWVRQSMPYSYVSIEASSLDGKAHDVRVYSDVSGEWLSGDTSVSMRWSTQSSGSSVFHEAVLQKPAPNTEVRDEAADGTLYYAMASRIGLTWQVDTDQNCRSKFKTDGKLTNQGSQAFNAPLSRPWTVFAISADLGSIQSTSQPIAWAVGLVRNPSIQYSLPSGNVQLRVPYFISQYGSRQSVDAFATDFPNALQNAIKLDEKILGDASKVSKEYADLVSISTRQVFASLDITLGNGADGGFNASDVKVFMKDMGRSRRVNPVEVIYAAFPTLLYFNASLGGALLSPLLEAQESARYQTFAAPDLGANYPVADGNPGPHNSGIEYTASMLIMAYAHAAVSGDGTLIQQHYPLLKKWADYLVANTLAPNFQASADMQSEANMTNLAVKGVIGVKAMAMISHALHNDTDGKNYDDRASSLAGTWLQLAVSSDKSHVLGRYGDQKSWALLYNLYYDRLLGLNVASDSVLRSQTAFYSGLFGSSGGPFGLPINDDSTQTGSAAWNLFTAATTTDSGVRDQFIRSTWAHATSNQSVGANPPLYDVSQGTSQGGEAGAAQGAMYALLALDVPKQNILVPSAQGSGDKSGGSSDSDSHKAPVGAIVGGVLGCLALLALGGLAGFLIHRRRRNAAVPPEHRGEFDHFTYQQPPAAPSGHNFSPGGMYPYGSPPGHMPYSSASAYSASSPSQALYPSRTDVTSPQSPGIPVPLPMSEKARERAGLHAQNPSVSSRGTHAPTVSSGRSRGTARTGGTHASGRSRAAGSDEVDGLRAEVENLRRVMEEVRGVAVIDAPPRYEG